MRGEIIVAALLGALVASVCWGLVAAQRVTPQECADACVPACARAIRNHWGDI
jgi:hypothetical protein